MGDPLSSSSDKKVTITLSLPSDVARFVRTHGHARKTDLTVGRVNISEEVAEFLRHNLMSKVTPEVLGWELARRKEELRSEIEDVDRQARDLFGVSSIEEWIAREKDGERMEADVVQAQATLREQIKEEKFRELGDLWRQYHSKGARPSRTNEIAWAKGHAKELRLLQITPEEFVARMGRHRDSPEVG